MKRIIRIIAATIFLCGLANAAGILVELKGHYFMPSEEAFRDVYGGGIEIGAEASVEIGRGLAVWLGGSYFSRKGELTFTKEETELRIMAFGGGIKYIFPAGAGIDIYGAAGVNYCSYDEENVLGEVSKGGVGVVMKAGGLVKIINGIFLDIYTSYSYCKMKPADFKINIGGFGAGVGLGYRF
ncbi:MAG: hypothetical protein GTO17_13385 [Candidatus Aminicenantes bacterium]|nr:hypothetical protein [Candidatus Aminicenantes bacterium]